MDSSIYVLGGHGSLLVIHHTGGGRRGAPEQAGELTKPASVYKEKNYEEGIQNQPLSQYGHAGAHTVSKHK